MNKDINIQDRALLYAKAFPQYPDSHFKISDRWISTTWIMGNNYKSKRGYYGSYPPGYLKRIWPMFTDCTNIIHLFSGSLTGKDAQPSHPATTRRIDNRPELNPDIVMNAESFADFTIDIDENVNLILADPPYSEEDSKHYGQCLCNKRKVLEQCYKALVKGGYLLWMDQSIPMYSKKKWKWVGVISIYRSTNHRIRGVMIFEKV